MPLGSKPARHQKIFNVHEGVLYFMAVNLHRPVSSHTTSDRELATVSVPWRLLVFPAGKRSGGAKPAERWSWGPKTLLRMNNCFLGEHLFHTWKNHR